MQLQTPDSWQKCKSHILEKTELSQVEDKNCISISHLV
jgi:hypothetical protein